jgi:serine/threonine-protein phosphatase 5
MNIETKKNSIFLANRAMVHIKMENIGLALIDANRAIEIDKDYIKAYYRRASANLFLNNFDEAIKDLEFIQTKYPNEESLKEKLAKARSERKKKKFLEVLATDRSSDK